MKYDFQGKTPVVHHSVYIAPGAQIIGDVTLGEDVTVWFNAVMRGDNDAINIGKGSNIQDGTIVHVDAGFPVTVGENVTVGHNVTLHGCTIEEGALIGMGATILNGAVVKKGALVAAGALVTEGTVIEAGTLAAGVPAKKRRNLTDAHLSRMVAGANHYVEKGRAFRQANILEEGYGK
ncbi:carbonic anhydrase/acetyltransferase-like protein (isoleucine patch superfamily) [Pullulanibacillus pueri]|uniref:Gamma carbonic anhydrase family protein n=1 Tax=Pullulanibacillus pueri TaxID=1437324 RepID=A0A8J3EMW2_9BACL|nr:gamma carbonic anhydrase family protein [Pullulanibacillus pueri]MBM7682949.1 carbonic anhydrase/acetyltransferase-like protein (isoleucine patch superfamily) [Pullulanibacillus pueri]GGH84698.1 gamma carbonic anhydrase family protein [Pullulanibacillus pueri]